MSFEQENLYRTTIGLLQYSSADSMYKFNISAQSIVVIYNI